MTDSITSKKLPRTANCQLRTGSAKQRGLFITFEGSEGCGKSTQITRLAERLRQKNPDRELVILREPGGTALGEQVRQVLQYMDPSVSIVPEAELLLFAASRAQLVREVIQPALERGAIVLCDRFFDSTTVYQGVARALDPKQVEMINYFSVGGVIPDMTFLLDMEAAQGRERMKQRNAQSTVVDRMEQEPEAFYEAVRQGYLTLAKEEKKRILVIDAAASVEEVSKKIMTQLDKYFLSTPQHLNSSTF
ncbi:MAG: dTMP kinase [Chthoniobacterales bacterium]|nr:dTMP kinase [Chthoniobacterales bacterium]